MTVKAHSGVKNSVKEKPSSELGATERTIAEGRTAVTTKGNQDCVVVLRWL